MVKRLQHHKVLDALLKMGLYLAVTFSYFTCQIADAAGDIFADKHSDRQDEDKNKGKSEIQIQEEGECRQKMHGRTNQSGNGRCESG